MLMLWFMSPPRTHNDNDDFFVNSIPLYNNYIFINLYFLFYLFIDLIYHFYISTVIVILQFLFFLFI